ncbi:MAG: trypsin-like peptidase domain-containing protein [Deltaproteobacteria bacterium]|nr:trypsin-like peptidase domain-containing protein [Deltaproteobacteria bacterium]
MRDVDGNARARGRCGRSGLFLRAVVFADVGLLIAACEAGPLTGQSDHGGSRSCQPATGLLEVATTLEDPDNPCHDWVLSIYGRAAQVDAFSHGSASLWSSGAPNGAFIVTTAAHVMSPCWSRLTQMQADGAEDPYCQATLVDPAMQVMDGSIRPASSDGLLASSQWTGAYPLFNAGFGPEELASPTGLAPHADFGVYVVGGQVFELWAPPDSVAALPLSPGPANFFDPGGVARRSPSWAESVPGSPAIVIGFPLGAAGVQGRRQSLSVGEVLSDASAQAAISELSGTGDAEGAIPYDSQSEFLMLGTALPGMSGSGVFDTAGDQIGILVRASTHRTVGNLQYLRCVRTAHVADELSSALGRLSAADSAVISLFVPPL